MTFLVTVKLPRNPAHDPTNKITGKCPVRGQCTDVTGQHHTLLIEAESIEAAAACFPDMHVTRIEGGM